MRLYQYLEQGGNIMYLLLAINIVGMTLIIYKFITLMKEKSDLAARSKEISALLKEESRNSQTLFNELKKIKISSYMEQLERGINTIKIIANISPLLGLLGTVIGILMAFRIMSETGLSNPSDFARGIYLALITTVGGLIVAIPHYIAHSYLLGHLDRIENGLEREIRFSEDRG